MSSLKEIEEKPRNKAWNNRQEKKPTLKIDVVRDKELSLQDTTNNTNWFQLHLDLQFCAPNPESSRKHPNTLPCDHPLAVD